MNTDLPLNSAAEFQLTVGHGEPGEGGIVLPGTVVGKPVWGSLEVAMDESRSQWVKAMMKDRFDRGLPTNGLDQVPCYTGHPVWNVVDSPRAVVMPWTPAPGEGTAQRAVRFHQEYVRQLLPTNEELERG